MANEREISAPSTESALLATLAERIGNSIHARTVYGEPVERQGVTVIPVAKARYGFGGGSGVSKAGEHGAGGGGGAFVKPIGYIEIRDGSSSFHSIRDPATFVSAIAVSGFFGWLALRSLVRLVRH